MSPHRSATGLSRRAIALLALIALPLVAHPLLAADIDPRIEAHRLEKAAASKDPESAADRLRALGLDRFEPDRVECAISIAAPLDAARRSTWESAGIEIHPTAGVPAVPGKHPHAFEVALVPYEALPMLDADPLVVRIVSLENRSHPSNDAARASVNADAVQSGLLSTARDGTGVRIAIADSGVDLSHPDIPAPVEAFDMTDGTDPTTWGTNVANTVDDHGTHVVGTALGRGVASIQYRGLAPGADLYFYKIGDDVNAATTDTDMIEAVNRALAVGCDVFSMSYGGVSAWLDGSSPVCQAIDNAHASGMVCVIAAGNEGDTARHASATVAPGGSASLAFTISNNGSTPYTGPEDLRVLWRDAVLDDNVSLGAVGLSPTESLVQPWAGASARGTEGRQYILTVDPIAPGASRTITFVVSNGAAGGTAPLVHLVRAAGRGTFDVPDPATTLDHPATADDALSVGAWVQRPGWNNSIGQWWSFPAWTEDTLAPFSSRGPRIDGVVKPDIVAPGAATISCRDTGTYPLVGFPAPGQVIDDDGIFGVGPAQYYVHWGTSMATPCVAGAAALLLEAVPLLSPQQLGDALRNTATQAATPDATVGSGKIDVLAALLSVDCNDNGVLDVDDIATGTSLDCNGNGRPDECDVIGGPWEFVVADRVTGGAPRDDAVGDFDGDGDDDVMLITNDGVDLFVNDGSGIFTRQENVTPFLPQMGAAGDFDGDGDLDVAIADNSEVLRMWNDGNGVLVQEGFFGILVPPSIGALTGIDLDHSGDDEIVVASSQLTVIDQDSSGTYTVTNHPLPTNAAPVTVAAADLDDDGWPDVVTANHAGSVSVFPNLGDGTLGSRSDIGTVATPVDLTIRDLDRDGFLDLVLANDEAHAVEVLWGDGTGAFPSVSPLDVGSTNGGHSVAVADLDGDGRFEVVTGRSNDTRLWVVPHLGARTFGPVDLITTPLGLGVPAVVRNLDVEGDGTDDLMVRQVTVNKVSFLHNGTELAVEIDCNGNGIPDQCEALPDCDGDGVPDECEIAGQDCNGNGVPDACDITSGTSADTNGNGLPDECEGTTSGPNLVRGDCNADGQGDIGDAVFVLGVLFSGGGPAPCDDACDSNDDGQIDIGDSIHGLAHLFSGGPAPSSPYPACGPDPTADGLLCASFAPCP